jgi:cupin 2 domain-containing protein
MGNDPDDNGIELWEPAGADLVRPPEPAEGGSTRSSAGRIPEVRSLFAGHDQGVGEVFSTLLEGGAFRMERVSSFGAASEPGFWYDQQQAEWVALLRGTATLEFEEGMIDMWSGDFLLLPARLKHRVVKTSTDAVWLALHFGGGAPPPCDRSGPP